MSNTCKYDVAWRGRCGIPVADGEQFCSDHVRKCCACDNPSVRECDYTGQFVCGSPLCENCEGREDLTRDSGNWGFLNHYHAPKKVATT
jgi:hypothetical protein